MTLNCDLHIDEARENFSSNPNDGTAADLMEAVQEYWRSELIDDKTCAIELRRIADYLDQAGSFAIPEVSANDR